MHAAHALRWGTLPIGGQAGGTAADRCTPTACTRRAQASAQRCSPDWCETAGRPGHGEGARGGGERTRAGRHPWAGPCGVAPGHEGVRRPVRADMYTDGRPTNAGPPVNRPKRARPQALESGHAIADSREASGPTLDPGARTSPQAGGSGHARFPGAKRDPPGPAGWTRPRYAWGAEASGHSRQSPPTAKHARRTASRPTLASRGTLGGASSRRRPGAR